MKIKEIKCKTALSKSLLPGLDYSLNPYRGCKHNCAYCYVPNVLRINREDWGCFIDVKTNIPTVLSKELIHKKQGVVGISTVTDPYQPIEKKYLLTRFCLEQLLKYDFPLCIQTKSSLIKRDMDIISKFTNVEVMISIGTIDDQQRKTLEPFASSINERLKIIQNLSDIGIKTCVFFGPIYPSILKSDIEKIINTFIENGVNEIMIDQLNLKQGIWKNIEKRLSNDKILLEIYNKNLFKNKLYYENIYKHIIQICNKRIKISKAF